MRNFNIKNTINQLKIKIYYSLVRIDKDVLIFAVLQLSCLRCCYLIARAPVPLVAQGEVTIFAPQFPEGVNLKG
jgi:hypothetical protein